MIKSAYCGIFNRGIGTVEIKSGIIVSDSTNNENRETAYGIKNLGTGTIIIGTKEDGLVSTENPSITGKYTGTSTTINGYAINNTNGKLYFYDGKLEGTTKAVYDIITEIEEDTELNYNEDETILTLSTTMKDVAQIGETTYVTLQEALDSVETEETTIKLLRNVTYTAQDEEIIIPNTKNIKLDLNGYRITSALSEKVIQNEGILEIIDTSEGQTGTIVTNEETTIKNIEGAQLIISGGTIENRTKQPIYNEGEVRITEGTVICSSSGNGSYGIYNNGSGSIEVRGGTVSSSGSTNYSSYGYGIYNHGSGNVIVRGGTVSSSSRGSSYGIYNASSGSVTVSGGIVSSSSYGIYNNSTGSITIGTKGESLSQEEPTIKANGRSSSSDVGYGIYNPQGTLTIYDGKIEGTTRGVYGNITEIEDLTELLISTETIDSSQYETIQLQQKESNVAKVNETEYDSIEKAIQACGETESTIQIIRDADPGATIVIEENQNITIDLNGYTVKNYPEITNKGTLKIVDTSSEQTGKMIGLTGIAITNIGTMELQSGNISDSGYGIKNTGTLTINGGNITNNTYGIYNDSNGMTIVTNGTISSNTYGIYNYASTSTTNITGGSLSSNTYGIYNNNGTTTITSTEMTNNEYGVYTAGGTVNINNNITGGTYGIYNAGGTTTIKENSQITSNTGIYNSKGTVNIGEQGTMNPDTPIITGEEFGLVNASAATVKMYDGQIKGKTGATQGYITNTETGYAVANKTEGEYMIDYLALAGTVSTVAQVNGIDFSNLQSAINSVIGEETQTIKLTNGITTSTTLHIEEGQNIILDMNGKTISSDLDVTITNNGNLTIIDSSGNNVAKISSTVGTAINNTGTLSLGQDDGTVTQDLINIEGTTYGIENSGTLNFYDGTINGASAVSGTITNRATGYVIRVTTVNSKERYYLST